MSLTIEIWKEWFSKHHDEIFQDYFQFLTFKSIATDPAFHQETKKCGQWLATYFQKIGFESELWTTSTQPVVFAQHCKAGHNRPTLLVYHHYDVQPVDPLELWESDPFTPVIKNGAVFARGAQDNKGQCFYSITSMKALLQLCEKLNFNLKVFIEGEEESGSIGTKDAIKKHKEALAADYLLVVDLGIPGPGIPAITLGVRGILTMEVMCRAANGDMHSGSLGGIAYNPIRALVKGLTSLWDAQGKVAIAHFYDQVQELTQEDAKQFDLEIDEERVKRDFGLRLLSPEPNYTIGQSGTIRPTIEINGIQGGYTGEGFKTVLPAVAKAKISCRLVPEQDPNRIFEFIKKHLIENMPNGLEITFKYDHGSFAFRSSGNSLIAKLVSKAYEDVLGKPCKKILTGGSIPIVVELAKQSSAQTIMMGYGLDSDQIHAPNEHFGVDRFEQGFLTMGRIFSQLHEQI